MIPERGRVKEKPLGVFSALSRHKNRFSSTQRTVAGDLQDSPLHIATNILYSVLSSTLTSDSTNNSRDYRDKLFVTIIAAIYFTDFAI